jgi:TonB family protein
MPHALLLSPDDQAVSAITGVLEEMSVTCERPLDGVSAAQKLSSQSFDLVLVDCENLPAAKLIFDVCRRGKNGKNPIPIAIVDGRAGLPTAFRLGAELILTKPVAKDQARSTIRTAVSRVRKDAPASEIVPVQPAREAAAKADMSSADMPSSDETKSVVTEERALAAAAGVSSQMTSSAEPVPSLISSPVANAASETISATPTAATKSAVGEDEIDVAPASPKLIAQSASAAAPSLQELSPVSAVSANLKPTIALRPSDDPVLAELEREELEESQPAKSQTEISEPAQPEAKKPAAKATAPVPSSRQPGRSKTRGLLVASLMLALAGAGFYAAWMYQPGFQAIAQSQINRLLVLAGAALAPMTPASSPAKPSTHAAPAAPAVAASGSATPPAQTQSTGQDSTTGAATGSATAPNASSAPVQPSSTSGAAAVPPPSAATNASANLVAKPEVNQPSAVGKDAATTLSDTQLPGESSAIVLSTKAAEQLLAQRVAPKYPVEARPQGSQGPVVLKEVVDENGKVAGVRLIEGNATLATAAIKAVKQWRYRPYLRDGKPQPFQTDVTIDFQRP